MSEWMRDGVSGVGRSIQMIGHCHEPSRRHMLRDQPRRTEEPSVPFRGAKEAHGKWNYVAVFAFETSAISQACS